MIAIGSVDAVTRRHWISCTSRRLAASWRSTLR
jgi:hypothetical protein